MANQAPGEFAGSSPDTAQRSLPNEYHSRGRKAKTLAFSGFNSLSRLGDRSEARGKSKSDKLSGHDLPRSSMKIENNSYCEVIPSFENRFRLCTITVPGAISRKRAIDLEEWPRNKN